MQLSWQAKARFEFDVWFNVMQHNWRGRQPRVNWWRFRRLAWAYLNYGKALIELQERIERGIE